MEQRLRGLSEVRLSKVELLTKIKENKAKHLVEYNEAMEGYKLALINSLEEALDHARTHGEYKFTFLPVPEDHSADYDRIISMLEMSKDDELELDQSEFVQYAMDDWTWKKNFTATASNYR